MVDIVSLIAVEPSAKERAIGEATQIFYATANTQSFDSPQVKHAFHQRWFGHYLQSEPEAFFLALDKSGAVIGYLAGCLDSFSEAARVIVEDISLYTPAFCAAMRDYPSHFHINVRPGHQGQGVGRLLVERFMQYSREKGSPGIHVVTGAESRAVQFYEARGFKHAEGDPDLAVLVCATVAP